MSNLFTAYSIRDIEFRNRIVVSPMCQYSSVDGFASDWHLVHLGSRAVGGAGLVFTEASAVEARGRISPQDLGIWKDEHIEMLSRINKFIESQGARAGTQLAHAGRKASTMRPWDGDGKVSPAEGGWVPVAPTAIAFNENYPLPTELSLTEIQEITQAFAAAAVRAHKAGFSVVEIHAAHGYLIHQFLSPLANQRTDSYGGSFENRTRLAREVVEAVRKVWPESLPLFMRVSATDWVEGGWTAEETVELAKLVKPLGVDLIDTSSGGMVPHAKIPVGPLYQVRFAEQIRRDAQIPTGAVGLITTPQEAEGILAAEQADLVFLAREELRSPYFPMHAAVELGEEPALPVQYERAKPRTTVASKK
jgi:2,4-dienoyl-CoA reductase-like NADH-dependent reductase (Old Yellow Enzyme family)